MTTGAPSDPATAERATPPAMPASRPVGMALSIAALLMVAVNLRPSLASVGPVLPAILHDLGAGAVFGGLLTTVPVLCMGALAPLSLRVATAFGAERTVLLSIALIGIATLVRLWTPIPGALLATSFGVGVGIAVAGTILPALAKTYFPGRVTLVTGLYAVGINVGAGLAAIGTAPIAQALGGSWREGLAAWSGLAVLAVGLWLPLAARRRGNIDDSPTRLPLRDWHAWTVTGFFAAQSFVYYGLLTWLASVYEELGWSRTEAGVLLAFFTLMQMLGALVMSAGAQRSGDTGAWIRLTALLNVAGLLLIATLPGRAPWLWVTILGLGVGGIFPLSLALPLLSTQTEEDARAWTSLTLGAGYLAAAAGPFAIGALRSGTGGFTVPFLAMAGINVAVVAGAGVIVPRLRRRVAS